MAAFVIQTFRINKNIKQFILPEAYHVSPLVVTDFHEKYHRCGRDQTLASIREEFWIINGRSVVRRILDKCLLCRGLKVKPKPQFMSDLPGERLGIYEPGFSYTGVGYFGTIILKQSKKTKTNSGQSKYYGVVFISLTTRVVHLEVAGNLSMDSFILALRRFIARRGQPKTISSDSGTNFVGANKELKTILSELNQSKISSTLINQKIARKFNPPPSPWMGGSWKSIVEITKRCLTYITKDRPMTYEALVPF